MTNSPASGTMVCALTYAHLVSLSAARPSYLTRRVLRILIACCNKLAMHQISAYSALRSVNPVNNLFGERNRH